MNALLFGQDWSIGSRLGVALGVLFAYPMLQGFYNVFLHPLRSIPGPRVWSATRLAFLRSLIRGTLLQDVEKLHQQYGPIVRIGPDDVAFTNAEVWPQVFQSRGSEELFLKDPTWWQANMGQAETLFSAINPEVHTRMRKTLTPAFTGRALRSQEPMLLVYVNLLIQRLRESVARGETEVDMTPWFNYTTFDIFGDIGFGESWHCLENSRFHPWIELVFNTVKAASYFSAVKFYPMLDFVLMRCVPPSLKKMQEQHFQQIADKVQKRVNLELERPDLMYYVMQSTEKNGMSMREIESTLALLTIAGSETTATLLSGTLSYLVDYPDQLAKVASEIRQQFASEDEITLDALRDMPYLNAVLSEVPAGGSTICGTWLAEGTRISIFPYAMQRDENNFYNASKFHPERWLPEASTSPTSPFYNDKRQALQPFSMGPRACLGQPLAWAEMRLILSKFLWTFDVGAVEGKKLVWEDLKSWILFDKQPAFVRIGLRRNTSSL